MLVVFHITTLIFGQPASPVLAAAEARFWRDMVIEGAGIFWIGAELAILFAVSVGGRVLRERPLPERLSLTRLERWWGAALTVMVVALTLTVYGRFLVLTPMPEAVASAAELDRPAIHRAVYGAITEHVRTHTAIWCSFIAVWVVLETVIVIQGIRAFHALAAVTGSRARPIGLGVVPALVLAAAALMAAESSAQFSGAIESALRSGYLAAMQEARIGFRFTEFYLRVAGAVWVMVEWVAAVYLVRGYFMLRRYFRGRAHVA